MEINKLGDFCDYIKRYGKRTKTYIDEKGVKWIKIIKK